YGYGKAVCRQVPDDGLPDPASAAGDEHRSDPGSCGQFLAVHSAIPPMSGLYRSAAALHQAVTVAGMQRQVLATFSPSYFQLRGTFWPHSDATTDNRGPAGRTAGRA